ncbi:hypothetical protein AGABI2DRAFT_195617 [Agaricus bisporus var. bisporus H97]|uniref:hypothetical protein n=1 Tax=Agaricus bisporus var. bisporus (strain H97 / ATCC MYA-4626 / FGSC 10389) TaxID=936046 RepID=UPI00029F5B71|nr:hypothetical protein AGABI2DRAFT_195617 [Agaricus bisporus var. bisporus H97]EKV42848.1 hypothetical protein AGABI2DRAFT_195617 [Agaricus bisporus var. bisporus H97]
MFGGIHSGMRGRISVSLADAIAVVRLRNGDLFRFRRTLTKANSSCRTARFTSFVDGR